MNKHTAVNVLFIVALLCLFFLNLTHDVSWGWFILLGLLYLVVSSIGSYFIQLNYFTDSYCHGQRDKSRIAITFDDGPNDHTARVLDILKEEKATATFFCIGRKIKGNESTLKRISEEGHIIGNHSFDHKTTFPLQSVKNITDEIVKCQRAIKSISGGRPLFFRPPFGVTDPMIAAALRHTGLYSIGWSVRTYDTVVSSHEKLLLKANKVRNGDIILFHEAGIHTATILSQFIKNLKAKGFEIVPLDQLLDIPAYEN